MLIENTLDFFWTDLFNPFEASAPFLYCLKIPKTRFRLIVIASKERKQWVKMGSIY